MKRIPFIPVTLLAFLMIASAALASDLIDRIVATVNGHIILQSDWEDALRYEAFVAGRAVDAVSMADRKAALDRLIDQELLREQMQAADFQHASDSEVTNRLREIRQQYPDGESEPGWQTLLTRYGLTEVQLKQHVSLQIDLMRLVDARLRPNVNIDSKSIESYYNQELLPQLRQSGAKHVPLAQVSPRIKEVLTERKVNQLLLAWLQNLRSGSEIRTETAPADSRGQLR